MKPHDVVLAVRAYTVRQDRRDGRQTKPTKLVTPWPRSVLVCDTETTIDTAQRGRMGA